MVFRVSRFGWLPDPPDYRDQLYVAPLEEARLLPAQTDLRPQCPPVYDQGELGSCTATAIAGVIELDRLKQKLADFTPLRLFIYYNDCVMEHSVDSGGGAQIRDGIKNVAKQGDCPEAEWPYFVAKFHIKPPKACRTDALKYKVVLYQRVAQTLVQLKGCLASGYPFVFGFTVYGCFENKKIAKTGHASLPQSSEVVIGARRRLRRREAAVHCPQFMGHSLGHERSFHAALRLRDRRRPGGRFLDRAHCSVNKTPKPKHKQP
jgi:C1A family cysteine protease